MKSAAALSVLCLALAACGRGGTDVEDRTVQVGCGNCQFHMQGAQGCFWAARFDDKVVPVRGEAVPIDHESHAPDGMCNVTRDAVVSGTLYDTYFEATKFDLQPVEPAVHPRYTPADVH